MENYLWETRKLFGDGKYKIHIILYIINSSEPRNFNQNEIKLIDFINKEMNIQIFFVCTLAENIKKATYRKENIKINLMQIFGSDTPLINFIYPCQLLDEKDGKTKRFGIDNLINGIYNFCKDQKHNLERTKRNISNNQYNNYYENLDNHNNNNYIQYYYRNKNLYNQNNNNYIQYYYRNKNLYNQNNNNYNEKNNIYNQPSDNQIFLKSLNHYNYNDLKNYLVNFCEDIIEYYVTYINEIEKKNFNLVSTEDENELNMDELRKIIAKMLIKHLAYELNGDLSNKEIKELIDSFEKSQLLVIKEIGNKAKEIFLKYFDDQSQNDGSRAKTSEQIYYNYFNNLIDDYKNAIDSLNNLYKKK